MNARAIIRRGVELSALCGLLLALCGCGPKAAPPAAPAKPKTDPAKTNGASVTQTNLADAYASVFEDLQPPAGKDPFFPNSHRRAKPVATSVEQPVSIPMDSLLVLKAVVRTPRHSQAVINSEIMEVGEEASVRVPNGKVKVRCLKIGKDYVEVQVEGEAEPRRLVMEKKKH